MFYSQNEENKGKNRRKGGKSVTDGSRRTLTEIVKTTVV